MKVKKINQQIPSKTRTKRRYLVLILKFVVMIVWISKDDYIIKMNKKGEDKKYFGIYFNSNLIPMWSYSTTSETNSKRILIGWILMFYLLFLFSFFDYYKQWDLKDKQRFIQMKIFFDKYVFIFFVCLIFLSWFFYFAFE